MQSAARTFAHADARVVAASTLPRQDNGGEGGAPADAVAALDGKGLPGGQVRQEDSGRLSAGRLVGDVPVWAGSR